MSEDSIFLIGVEEKYDPRLLEGRISCEGNVLGCLYEDVTLLDEHPIPNGYFLTKEGRFFFKLLLDLKSKNKELMIVDDTSIRSDIEFEDIDEYEMYGGFDTIENFMSHVDTQNFTAYYDKFIKMNLLNKLYLDGFNLFDAVKYPGQKEAFIPFDLFETYSSEEVLDFYDTLLSGYDVGDQSMIIEESDLGFSKEWVDKLESGEELVRPGTPYGIMGTDEEGKPIYCFKRLSDQTVGLHHGKLACVAAFSGVGKTTMSANVILGLVNKGEKVLILSNEDTADDYRTRILCIICYKFLHYDGVDRDKFKKNNFTEEDKVVLRKAMDIFNKQYRDNIAFVGMSETNMRLIGRKIKEYHLRKGYSAFWVDTLKLGEADFKNARTDLALVGNSRTLENLAKKYDMIGCCSVQLAERHRGVLSATAAQLSTAKAIKEILQQLFIGRPLFNNEELDPSNKRTYCHPFTWEYDPITDTWVETEYTPDPKDSYIVLAIDKNRDGAGTGTDGISYLYKFDGKHSTFEEVCYCRTAQTSVAPNS